jgi:hypothetical protein
MDLFLENNNKRVRSEKREQRIKGRENKKETRRRIEGKGKTGDLWI